MIIIAITLSITLTADNNRNAEAAPFVSTAGEPITFDEFLNYEFTAKSFNGSWYNDTMLQWRDRENNLVLWNVNTNETTILVGADTVGQISKFAQFVDFAPKDNTLLLFYDNVERVWRHSFVAEYLILDSKTNKTLPVIEGLKLQYAKWVRYFFTFRNMYSRTENRQCYILITPRRKNNFTQTIERFLCRHSRNFFKNTVIFNMLFIWLLECCFRKKRLHDLPLTRKMAHEYL